MKTLSSFLHRGVFHFQLSVSPRPDKVTRLSSLQMPAPQKETTLLRKRLVVVQLSNRNRSTGIMLKCVFPSNQRVIFSCTLSTTNTRVKRKQLFILSCSCLCITLYSTVYLSQSNLSIEKKILLEKYCLIKLIASKILLKDGQEEYNNGLLFPFKQ